MIDSQVFPKDQSPWLISRDPFRPSHLGTPVVHAHCMASIGRVAVWCFRSTLLPARWPTGGVGGGGESEEDVGSGSGSSSWGETAPLRHYLLAVDGSSHVERPEGLGATGGLIGSVYVGQVALGADAEASRSCIRPPYGEREGEQRGSAVTGLVPVFVYIGVT